MLYYMAVHFTIIIKSEPFEKKNPKKIPPKKNQKKNQTNRFNK